MNVKSIIEIRGIFEKRRGEVYSFPLALKIVRFLESTKTVDALFRERMIRILDECVEKDEVGDFVPAAGGYKLRTEKIKDYEEKKRELEEEMTEDTIFFSEKEIEELRLTVDELFAASAYLEV